MPDPAFSLGIEEEYLLTDPATGALAEMPKSMMPACRDRLGNRVSPEFLRCQVEVGTAVCADMTEARADLSDLRLGILEVAEDHGLVPIAAGCHPFSDWKDQSVTRKDRYRDLARDMHGVARRMLICGMHVHIGIEDPEMRIDLANQMTYFLPHLLALSASSPFWQGTDTGLASYRPAVFDNMPRTGLPPRFDSWSDFRRSVDVLVDLELIEDSSKIWWDLRPSHGFPTVETRICDVTPRIDDALTIAALVQATMRMLWRLSQRNQRWRIYDRFLIEENRWRAQRYGASGPGLIDFGERRIRPLTELVAEWTDLVMEDAAELGGADDLVRVLGMARAGTGADRQRRAHADAMAGGATEVEAMRAVVAHLAAEFREGL
jgi:carboxylate-amine ligase